MSAASRAKSLRRALAPLLLAGALSLLPRAGGDGASCSASGVCGGDNDFGMSSLEPPLDALDVHDAHDDGHAHGHSHSREEAHDHAHAHAHAHAHTHAHSHAHAHEHGAHVVSPLSSHSSSSSSSAPPSPAASLSALPLPHHPATAVLMTLGSGLTAVLGGLIVVCLGVPSDRALGHMLSFAAGVMLYISYADILLHSVADLDALAEEGALAAFGHPPAAAGHDDHGHDHGTGHGHSHGPGSLYANAFLFAGCLFYLAVSALLALLPGGADAHGHGHSHDAHAHAHAHGAAGEEGECAAAEAAELAGAAAERAPLLAAPSLPLPSSAVAGGSLATAGEPSPTAGAAAAAAPAAKERPLAAAAAVAKPAAASALRVSADRRGLLLTGLSAAVGIAAHNLPEGLVVYNHTIGGICAVEAGAPPLQWWQLPADPARCLSRGVAMTLAIALHNIPEGMAVAAPVFAATGSWARAMQYCVLSSLGEPLAAVLFGLVFSGGLTRLAMACVNAFTAGIMVALCIAELMPEAARRAGGPQAALSNLAGQALMCGSILLMRSAGVH